MIDIIKFSTGAASGGAGVATATGHSVALQAKVLAVHVAYKDSPPGTTDVTLSDEHDPASESIVSLPNNNTDTKLYPRRQVEDNADNGLTFDGSNPLSEPYVVHGRLEGAIAQADNGDSAEFTVWIER